MDAVKTTRELCDEICRSSTTSETEKWLARHYRDLHDAARVANETLMEHAKGLDREGATWEVITDLHQELTR